MNTTPSQPVRQRGGCLSLYLLVAIFGSVLGLLAVSGANALNAQLAAAGQAVVDIPSWYVPAEVALIVLTLVAIYGIFTWKKWGVYLLIAQWVISLLVNIVGGQGLGTSIVSLLIQAALLAFVLRDKWALFEG